MRVLVAGGGAFGIKHLNGIKNIDGVEVAAHRRATSRADGRSSRQEFM